MKLLNLKRKTTQKVAVLATGLAVAMMVSTISPPPAQAFPRAASCAGCHGAATANTVTAAPSTATPAPGATYTVAINLTANAAGGDTGYGIVPVAPAMEKTFGGGTGTGALSYTATMIAPTAAGTYSYTVWSDQGPTDGSARVGSVVYSITVAAAPVVVTTTTALAVTPASPVVAPASPTLTATVSGAGAAGTVEFFNGTTSLGTPIAVAAGVATKALTGIAAGSYSYKAVFTPTNAAAFTSSTSSVVAYVVNVASPVVVTTTTALAVTPASPVVAPASPTLTATVSGVGAAGTVEFFNGTTSLGTPIAVAAGVATKSLTGIAAGSYSYKAVFTPTNAAAFTSSTSSVVAYVVNVAPPVISAPVITSLSPNHGVVGTIVTINGSNFGTAGVVTFGAAAVTSTSWTDTAITFVVPVGTRSALVSVTPTDDVASNLVKFRFEHVKVPRV